MIDLPEITPEQAARVEALRLIMAPPGFTFYGNVTIQPLDYGIAPATRVIAGLERRFGSDNVYVVTVTFNQAGGPVPNAVAVYLRQGAQPRSWWQRVIGRLAD